MTTASSESERGATAVEYGLIVALLAAAIVTAVLMFGGGVTGLFENTSASFDSAISP